MTKKEMLKAKDSEIIVDYIRSYSLYCSNMVTHRGTVAVDRHLKDLDVEMLRRGILSQEQVDFLNS